MGMDIVVTKLVNIVTYLYHSICGIVMMVYHGYMMLYGDIIIRQQIWPIHIILTMLIISFHQMDMLWGYYWNISEHLDTS